MGAWNHNLFGNDGAADLIAALKGADDGGLGAVRGALAALEAFFERDARGETFRPSTPEELAADDAAVRAALADLPELLAQWNSDGPVPDVLCDTGDHEAQAAVAAAALVLDALDGAAPARARGPRLRAAPSADDVRRAQAGLQSILDHARLRDAFPARWVAQVRQLSDALNAR